MTEKSYDSAAGDYLNQGDLLHTYAWCYSTNFSPIQHGHSVRPRRIFSSSRWSIRVANINPKFIYLCIHFISFFYMDKELRASFFLFVNFATHLPQSIYRLGQHFFLFMGINQFYSCYIFTIWFQQIVGLFILVSHKDHTFL